jgi:F0F1-type ATP synthase epsilon subunit
LAFLSTNGSIKFLFVSAGFVCVCHRQVSIFVETVEKGRVFILIHGILHKVL